MNDTRDRETPAVASIETIRASFPALRRMFDDRPVGYFDAPGGTQVPSVVAEAIYDNTPAARVRLLGAALGSLRLEAGGRIATMALPRDVLYAERLALDDHESPRRFQLHYARADQVLLTLLGAQRETEGVAGEVGDVLDLRHLVVVRQDDGALLLPKSVDLLGELTPAEILFAGIGNVVVV